MFSEQNLPSTLHGSEWFRTNPLLPKEPMLCPEYRSC
jgi:hypothetical protein